MITCKFTTVPMPQDNNQQIAGHLCDTCKHQKWVGDGGQDEASGTWEYYWQGCALQISGGLYLPRCVDPFWDGPDENDNTEIVTECDAFTKKDGMR